MLYLVGADPDDGRYETERNETAENLGLRLTRLTESDNRVQGDEHRRKRRTEHAYKQEAKNCGDPSPFFTFVIRIFLHAPACPDTTMEDLRDLEANV